MNTRRFSHKTQAVAQTAASVMYLLWLTITFAMPVFSAEVSAETHSHIKTDTPSLQPGLTEEEQAWLDKNYTVRVRVANQPPWESGEPEPHGMGIDFITHIGEKYGIDFTLVPAKEAWIDGFNDMAGEHRQYDLVLAAKRTDERLTQLAMSDHYLFSPLAIIARTDTSTIKNLKGLRGKKVSVERGYVMNELLKKNEPDIQLVVGENTEDALMALYTGKADAYIGSFVVTSHLIKNKGITTLKVAGFTPYGDHNQAMATRKEWAPLISIINKGLNSMTPQEISRIQNKYAVVLYDHGITTSDVVKWILMVVVVASGIIFLFFLWNKSLQKQVQNRTTELKALNKSLESKTREVTQQNNLNRSVLSSIDSHISVLDRDGEIIAINDSWNAFARANNADVLEKIGVGANYLDASLADMSDNGQRAGNGIQAVLDGRLPGFNMEYECSSPSKKRWFSMTVTPMRTEQGGAVVVHTDITGRKQADNKLQLYQQRLKSLAVQLALAEEQERRRIAADLHDNVGQSLALTRLQLAAARKHLPKEKKLDAELEDISQSLLKAIQDTRNLIFELSSPSLNEIGLAAAIGEWLENQAENKHGLLAEVVDHAKDVTLDPDLRAILFRSVRELLTNVIKHARAKTVSVCLQGTAGQLVITIQDDGVGFNPDSVMQDKRGFGLFSVQERMTDLGGTLEIVSQPGASCKIVLCVPIPTMSPDTSE